MPGKELSTMHRFRLLSLVVPVLLCGQLGCSALESLVSDAQTADAYHAAATAAEPAATDEVNSILVTACRKVGLVASRRATDAQKALTSGGAAAAKPAAAKSDQAQASLKSLCKLAGVAPAPLPVAASASDAGPPVPLPDGGAGVPQDLAPPRRPDGAPPHDAGHGAG
jgi:hypothetical protein